MTCLLACLGKAEGEGVVQQRVLFQGVVSGTCLSGNTFCKTSPLFQPSVLTYCFGPGRCKPPCFRACSSHMVPSNSMGITKTQGVVPPFLSGGCPTLFRVVVQPHCFGRLSRVIMLNNSSGDKQAKSHGERAAFHSIHSVVRRSLIAMCAGAKLSYHAGIGNRNGTSNLYITTSKETLQSSIQQMVRMRNWQRWAHFSYIHSRKLQR